MQQTRIVIHPILNSFDRQYSDRAPSSSGSGWPIHTYVTICVNVLHSACSGLRLMFSQYLSPSHSFFYFTSSTSPSPHSFKLPLSLPLPFPPSLPPSSYPPSLTYVSLISPPHIPEAKPPQYIPHQHLITSILNIIG